MKTRDRSQVHLNKGPQRFLPRLQLQRLQRRLNPPNGAVVRLKSSPLNITPNITGLLIIDLWEELAELAGEPNHLRYVKTVVPLIISS